MTSNCFPRGTDLPSQSPLFWVQHKDRYLRQLLIRDIEAETGRRLIVYHSDCNADVQIDMGDDVHLTELLNEVDVAPVDLMIETNGGGTDATEKLCSLLAAGDRDLRVIVPRRAKSNGTVIAMTGAVVVMGVESELGPIDPFVLDAPAEFIIAAFEAKAPVNAIHYQIAIRARDQTKKLATDVLSTRMLRGQPANVIEDIVAKLASRNVYHSHGSVVSATEAAALGLNVDMRAPADPFWRKCCLLRAMYQQDCTLIGAGKIFESARISLVISRPRAQPSPAP